MNRKTIAKSLSIAAVAFLLLALVFWSPISEAFGPMTQRESQCLICDRERVQKSVCGREVQDEVSENEHSKWIDSFTPQDHEHVWAGHTHYFRKYWFGSKSIGCGGIAVISRIYAQRSSLGESAAQRLVVRFQNIVRGSTPQIDWQELRRFESSLAENPSALLELDDQH